MIRRNRVVRCAAVAAVSLASIFATSAVAMASPAPRAGVHHALVVKGTVTVLTPASGTPTSLTIQPLNPAAPSENILLSASTVYVQNGATVTVSALAVGEPVAIELTGVPATAATVRILTPRPILLGGRVSALTPSSGTPTSVTIQPTDPKRPTLNIDLGPGTLYFLGGKTTTVASLVVGAQVRLEATGNPATATVVEIALPRPIYIDGKVTALDTSSATPTWFTIMPAGPHTVAVNVDLGPSTVYRQAGVVVTVADLLVGSTVAVTASGTPLTATVVHIALPKPVHLEGVVTALNPASGTPTSVTVQPDGFFQTPVTVSLGGSTVYYQLGATTTVDSLLVGSHVALTATGNPLTATVVHISAPLADVTIGSVTAVTATSLTVQPMAAGSSAVTFMLTNATNYYSGRRVATIAAVNVGDVVRVAANGATPTTAFSVTVRQMVIIGKVTAVAGNVISVTGFYGASLTIDVTATTVYQLDGQASSLASVLTGDVVVGMGPALSGVTNSVTATNVWIGTEHNWIFHNALIQHRLAVLRHHH